MPLHIQQVIILKLLTFLEEDINSKSVKYILNPITSLHPHLPLLKHTDLSLNKPPHKYNLSKLNKPIYYSHAFFSPEGSLRTPINSAGTMSEAT